MSSSSSTKSKILENGSIPVVPQQSLGQFLFKQLNKFSNNICQVDANLGKSETFASVKLRSVRLALHLQQYGIKPNDVILTCSNNSLESVIPILAGTYLGCILSNLDPTLSIIQTTHLINLTQPKIIFSDLNSMDLIEKSIKELKIKPEIIIFGENNKFINLFDVVGSQKEGENNFQPVSVDLDSIAIIFFSSGTTGLPKGICHSHKTFLNLVAVSQIEEYSIGSGLHFTTFYWISGMLITVRLLLTGHKRVFSKDVDGDQLLKIIEKEKVSYLFVAPLYTYRLTSTPNIDKYDISHFKNIITGGTSISTRQLEQLQLTFPNTNVIFGYGMSECGMISFMNCKPFILEKKREMLKSVGKITVGIKLKIADLNTGRALGCNEEGEIRVKTPCAMIQYYKQDSKNCFDSDGFLKTGDIGYYDENNYLFIVGRIKEMFKYKSWHIVPSQIEAVILEHPNVQEAIVFGIYQNEEEGDLPAACIVLKNGTTVSEEEIQEFVAEKLSDREKLRGGVVFLESLPRTPTGKLIRKNIQDFIGKNKKQVV